MPPKAAPPSVDFAGLLPRTRVLAYYGRDGYFHDRVLLAQVAATIWVVCTAHWNVYIEDLSEYAQIYPVGPGGGVHFSLSRVPRIRFNNAELRRRLPDLLRNGETKAATERGFGFVPNSTGGPTAAPVAAEVSLGAGWIAMEEKGRYKIGDDAAGASATVRGDRALVRLADGSYMASARRGTFDVLVASADRRTLVVKYSDSAGTQFARPFAESVSLLSKTPFVDWPLHGPRTLLWLLYAMVASNTAPLGRHYWWRGVLQLGASDEGVEEHEFLSSVIESALTYDQLCATELASFEHISRRYMLWEERYASSLRARLGASGSDFGLDTGERSLFMGLTSHQMALVSPELSTWVSNRVGERSAILKERRKGREERLLALGGQARIGGNAANGAPASNRGGRSRRKKGGGGKPDPPQ